jgi:cyclopropane fatty-acyl-phospholipid synthase-like methyltransferase
MVEIFARIDWKVRFGIRNQISGVDFISAYFLICSIQPLQRHPIKAFLPTMIQRVAEYDAKMEIMHPNRTKMADIVCAMLPFPPDAEITVLDLGTGTGFLVARLLQVFPHAHVIAVDGASAMMQQAQARLGDQSRQLTWKIESFQQLADDNDLPELDAAVSAFALHHLAAEEKRRLYHALHAKLRDGAWFVNADIVVAPHEEIETHYQHLRQLGIQKRWREHGEEKSLAAIAKED